MSFRGINTTVIQIRRQVFTEVARMAYANVKGEAANHLMRKIPYTRAHFSTSSTRLVPVSRP